MCVAAKRKDYNIVLGITYMKMASESPRDILCICIHNSARSQMAEAYLTVLGGPAIRASSAGLEKGRINPYVVEVMREDGIDLGNKGTRTVEEILRSGAAFDVVITVCDDAARERCPLFPGGGRLLHWPFPDPSAFRGSPDEIRDQTREVRDMIKAKVKEYLASRGI